MDKRIQQLVRRSNYWFELSTQPHKWNCETIQKYMQNIMNIDDDFYKDNEEEVINKIIELDQLVEIRFYPSSTVWFYQIYHYDLDKALDEACKCLWINVK